jgi:hypothetical protein
MGFARALSPIAAGISKQAMNQLLRSLEDLGYSSRSDAQQLLQMFPLALGQALCAGNDQLGPGILDVWVSSRTVVPGTVA